MTSRRAFATMLGHWGGATVMREGPELKVAPTVHGQLCGQVVLPVAQGETRTVAVRIADDAVPAHVDDDTFDLTCAATP